MTERYSSIDIVKTAGKWAITLTVPFWILPAMVVSLVVLIFAGVHDSLWKKR
jgi:hypothetical protein